MPLSQPGTLDGAATRADGGASVTDFATATTAAVTVTHTRRAAAARWWRSAVHGVKPRAIGFIGRLVVRGVQRDLRHCFDASLVDQEANRLAQRFMQRYRQADEGGRLALLQSVANESARHDFESKRFVDYLDSPRIRFFKRFSTSPDGLEFLVRLRADMLRQSSRIVGLVRLEEDLASLFGIWFDVGFLELRRITWDSPASLLEKLMRYEAVHPITSWNDLRRRLAEDRQCYAFFHPRMDQEPLIFVEVALVDQLSQDIGSLLDEAASIVEETRRRWAVFYSISNTQFGLRGVSFGNFLLKRAIARVQGDFPRLERFATLSPIPGLAAWVGALSAEKAERILGTERALLLGKENGGPMSLEGQDLSQWLSQIEEPQPPKSARREIGLRLAAFYLVREQRNGQPRDPVARFHFGNGAQIERLNWRADASEKAQRESFGIMVNYRYVVTDLDENLARARTGTPRSSRAIAQLL